MSLDNLRVGERYVRTLANQTHLGDPTLAKPTLLKHTRKTEISYCTTIKASQSLRQKPKEIASSKYSPNIFVFVIYRLFQNGHANSKPHREQFYSKIIRKLMFFHVIKTHLLFKLLFSGVFLTC